MSDELTCILQKYYNEANKGLKNDKAPSGLNRGQGTEKGYYIFKIDLVKSTFFLATRLSQTYLKLAHVFLSSIDEITRKYSADASQVEYAGDSVLAYFDASKVPALDVLLAAYWSREAALKMKALDPAFKSYNCKTKVVLHYGKLIMAKIGPWGDYRISAIGKELHRVAKLEKKVTGGVGHVTKEFAQRLELKARRKLLGGVYESKKIEVQQTTPSIQSQPIRRPTNFLASLLADSAPTHHPTTNSLLGLGHLVPPVTRPTLLTGGLAETTSNTEKVLTHWQVRWPLVQQYIYGKLKL